MLLQTSTDLVIAKSYEPTLECRLISLNSRLIVFTYTLHSHRLKHLGVRLAETDDDLARELGKADKNQLVDHSKDTKPGNASVPVGLSGPGLQTRHKMTKGVPMLPTSASVPMPEMNRAARALAAELSLGHSEISVKRSEAVLQTSAGDLALVQYAQAMGLKPSLKSDPSIRKSSLLDTKYPPGIEVPLGGDLRLRIRRLKGVVVRAGMTVVAQVCVQHSSHPLSPPCKYLNAQLEPTSASSF